MLPNFGVVFLKILVNEILPRILQCVQSVSRRLSQKAARRLVFLGNRHILVDLHADKLLVHVLYFVAEILSCVLLHKLPQVHVSRLNLNFL